MFWIVGFSLNILKMSKNIKMQEVENAFLLNNYILIIYLNEHYDYENNINQLFNLRQA